MPWKDKAKRKEYNAAYRARLAAEGRCRFCSKASVAPGRTKCADCLEHFRGREEIRRHVLRVEGRCIHCAAHPARPGRRLCESCSIKMIHQRRQATHQISPETFRDMLRAQNNRCAICETEFGDRIEIDHDHVSGKVRKLLCGKCNRVLGQANESIHILAAAARYLYEHRA